MKKPWNYKPKDYWERRLEGQPDLRGVGCIGFNENYNNYLYSLKISALENVLNKYPIIIKGKSILDVGCGTGFFVDYYNKKGAKKITGVDITKKSISLLKEKYPFYNFQVADISEPDLYFKESFDIVNVFDVLYHITEDSQFEAAIHNISSLCVKGYILITDIFSKNDIYPAEHVHFRNLQKYEKEFNKNNVEILEIFPVYQLMNQSFHLPSFILNRFCPILFFIDRNLQNIKVPNGKNIKLLVGVKYK